MTSSFEIMLMASLFYTQAPLPFPFPLDLAPALAPPSRLRAASRFATCSAARLRSRSCLAAIAAPTICRSFFTLRPNDATARRKTPKTPSTMYPVFEFASAPFPDMLRGKE
eukprot:TRINITY_DN30082_c0_g1_i2.p2 TRINITY_DN30082_c0_g1~~TRINITY_DN30082_c0_g1_i2.p2  ORF type:complete len:111 (-),score=11.51 TRINITY_DN30082_c0_g1_i2:106-438(-)